ncbi:hypothetical protein CHCC20441_4618 [Bacillus licheniformis]|uniref:Uncharacterized protein n=1 Tax=Bacillus licheniformis TaxID=1402 RepID=A0A8B5YB70_BACLI|nr:hypothetical protein B4090_3199 [Bacillus licheniformis]TWN15716.1 hypothetical protein CHCC14564_0281 [Bacillus licheniformis LMG 17339]OLF86028.1 hypothetical protein B4094_4492 [Bacillus licheniformis]OLF88966.1 hypothetical protein B4089_3061 [Bacillus licheniformis]OLG09816.1 hypothetical protein B4124_0460 [Bacillus licheniformis]
MVPRKEKPFRPFGLQGVQRQQWAGRLFLAAKADWIHALRHIYIDYFLKNNCE